MNKKDILSVNDLNNEQILQILDSSDSFMEVLERDLKKIPVLRGKTIVNLFYEPSTRTKTSFELAAKRLSADVINFSPLNSSLKKGETELDTLRTIIDMKVDLAVIRHSDSGYVKYFAKNVNLPVINAGDGKHEHPTQAFLDLYTIFKHFKQFKDLRVAIVGDVLNSRVARSNILLFKKMGMEVFVVAPSMLLPENMDFFDIKSFKSIDDVIDEVDVLYMLRMQFERQNKKFYPSINEYNRFLTLNKTRFEKIKENSLIMHPGPVNRGIEISSEIMELEEKYPDKIKIDSQVTNGVAVRMALLYYALS